MRKQHFILLICLLLLSNVAVSQEQNSETSRVIVILLDKSEINGRLVEEDDLKIVVQSETLGLLTFQKIDIKKIIRLDEKGRLPNPNPTRYFLGQSAYTLPAGEGYYQNIMGLVNLASIGITDQLSATAGFELITLVQGSPILFGNLKYGLPLTRKFSMALSASYLTLVGSVFDDSFNIGSLNLLGTYGTKENNLTIGAGYGLASGGISDSPVITIGGMMRVSKKIGLVTENYLLTGESSGITSFGFRFIGKKKTIDLMIFEGGVPAIDIVLQF